MAKFFTPTRLSENIAETPEGFLLCLNVPIARTGWQEYGDGETPLEVGDDGVVWVYRDAAEVFKPQTIASFMAKSITIRHPDEFVKPENWKELSYGSIQNVRKGDEQDEDGEEMLLADLLITDDMAIGLVKNGLREVSCGYEAEYEQTGEGEGRQFNIVGNHCALVEYGRAGPTYAINDEKWKGEDMKTLKEIAEVIKNLSKTVDQKLALDAKKATKAKTGDSDEDKEKKTGDEPSYDELVKAVKDLSEKVEGMGKGKDEKEEDEKEEPAKEDKADDEESEDDDAEEGKMEERLKALEAAVAKLLKGKSSDEDEEESEDEDDMSGDEDSEESEDADESEDAEEEKKEEKKTGDAARAEILAPGVRATKGECLKTKALKAAYKTDEGKQAIETLTGGKKPTFDSKEKVAMLFVAASELLKAQRGTGLEGTKDSKNFEVGDSKTVIMTAEKQNELNAAHWARK